MIVGGLTSLVTGLIMALWPGKTLLFVAALIGGWLLVAGLIQLARAFMRRQLSGLRRVLIGVSGLLYLVVGATCLRNLFVSLALLTAIVGLVWTVGGAAEIAGGFPRFWPTVLGLLSMAAGVIVFLWPKPSLLTLTVFVGLWLILIGVIQIVLAVLAFRRYRAMTEAANG